MSSYAVYNKMETDDITNGGTDFALDSYKGMEEIITRLQESFYFGLIAKGTLQDLEETFIETSIPNWDGYDALPVKKETFIIAEKFIKMLPLYITPPSISVEPDGSITLEWYRTNNWLFSLSIDEKSYLHYAAKFGMKRYHGSEPFFDSIPQIILDLIIVADR
ncbi:MAG: hypothetical protein P8107_14725 [Spirochaetia bacterium]